MSIIPNPGSQPDVIPTEEEILLNTGGITIAADDVYYATQLSTLIRLQEDRQSVVNNGTVWLESDGAQLFFVVGYYPEITNHGTIYLRGEGQVAINNGANIYTNTGTMIAVSNTGVARVVQANISAAVDNSGIIAAQSLGDPTDDAAFANATAISSHNGSQVVNHATGQILAEAGGLAIAIDSGGSDPNADTPIVTNHGLIEANATSDDGRSFGIFSAQGGTTATIVNSGTIRAEFAIYATYNTTTPTEAVEHISNLSGGVIEGIVFLDLGNDIVENDGSIIGNVYMGDGDDTFSGTGTVDGVVDMGFGDDAYDGGVSADLVDAGRGDDDISGHGGNDLLLGGFGQDVISGGSGNDGMFGEWGDDTLITEGGDYVDGGSGVDQVILGDYTFEGVHGGVGFDILVMASGARNFSLAEMVAGSRISGFEAIELQGNQEIVVDAASIASLSNQNMSLRIDATATDTVHLAGAWTHVGTGSGSVTYDVYEQGDSTVYVPIGVSVIANSAPDFGGFDAVASGAAALRPSEEVGLDYTSQATYLVGYEPTDFEAGSYPDVASFSVEAEEIFFTDGTAPIFDVGYARLDQFINQGELYAINSYSDRAVGISLHNGVRLINTNLIVAEATGTQISELIDIPQWTWGAEMSVGGLANYGQISSYSASGNAGGVRLPGTTENSGLISAISEFGQARGISRATGTDSSAASRFANTGTIYAEGNNNSDPSIPDPAFLGPLGNAVAIGVYGVGSFVNDGVIQAVVGGNAQEGAYSYGIYVYSNSGSTGSTITNNGQLIGTIAAYFEGTGTNTLDNNGTIVGDIEFSSGADIYDNSEGTTRGVVYGFGGNDSLIGGNEADVLVGGADNDTLNGGGNVDTAIVSGNQADYTVTQTSTGVFEVTGADGTDTLTAVEFLQFDDATMRLLPGTGVSVNFETTDTSTYALAMENIRDFGGNDLGGDGGWIRIGAADVNGDGDIDQILVNSTIGRFATVATADDGLVYFDDHGWAGETRVAGIYIDPLVTSGHVESGGPHDSQTRFQNDLMIGNIGRVLGADDYDGDGLQEVYFAIADGTAYLHAYMHADGNIQYANYQVEAQVIEFLTANGFDASTYAGWFDDGGENAEPVQDDKQEEARPEQLIQTELGDPSFETFLESHVITPYGDQPIEVFA